MKLLKTQLHKIGQSGRFLGRFLETLLKFGKTGLAYSVMIPLGLTAAAAAAATDAAIH